jgi:hypothetical protein
MLRKKSHKFHPKNAKKRMYTKLIWTHSSKRILSFGKKRFLTTKLPYKNLSIKNLSLTLKIKVEFMYR